MKSLMIITYWGYYDALIQSYTLPYVKIIRKILPADCKIILVTFERNTPAESEISIEEGITNVQFRLHGFGISAIREIFRSLRELKKIIARENVAALHGWCATGNGIAWLLSRRTRIPFLADSFEPNAEAMVECGTWKRSSAAFRLQFWLEKKTAHAAKELIAISPHMQNYLRSKYKSARKIKYVKPACVDLDRFYPKNKISSDNSPANTTNTPIVCVYVGKLGGFYLDQEVFDFFAAAEKKWGERFRVIMLSPLTEAEVETFTKQSGFERKKLQLLFVPHDQVPEYLRQADFAISPFKPVPSRLTCSPIKNGEYWASGLPVVITEGISNDTELILENKCGAVIQSINTMGYNRALDEIDTLISSEAAKSATAARCRKLAEQYRNFQIAEDIYKDIYSNFHR